MSSKLEYLKRYASGGGDGGDGAGGEPRKKRRKKKHCEAAGAERRGEGNVALVDGDAALAGFEARRRAERVAATAAGGGLQGGFIDGGAALAAAEVPTQQQPSWQASAQGTASRARAESGWAEVARPGAGGCGDGESDEDLSPPRRTRHDSPSVGGTSPPRRQRHDSPDDLSPPRRQRHDSPDDLSPPRRQRHDSPDDLSPPRRQRHDSPVDLSPPRRQRHDSPDGLSPPRRQRHDSPDDLSPPRRQRHDSPDGLSPPRRQRHDSPDGLSPPRRQRHDSPEGSDRDLSPPRKVKTEAGTTGGPAAFKPKAGLRTAKEMKAEAVAMREAEAARMARFGDEASGRGAATVARGRDGKRLDDVGAAARERKEAEAAARAVPWAGGLAQKRAVAAAKRELAEVAAQPWAVSADRRDGELRSRARFGDPMAELAAKQEAEAAAAAAQRGPFESAEEEAAAREAGYQIPSGVPEHSWMRRGVGAPPNRYGIKPGRFWDGVDRSTGFEQKVFAAAANRAARARAGRNMSTADM